LFEIYLTKTFAREFKKFGKKERERVKKKLFSSARNPLHFFERLTGDGLFKLRIGKYRIIAQINFSKRKIILLSIKHRKKVYRKL